MPKSLPLWEIIDRNSLQELVPTDSTVLVGVSGGADSVALLLALHTLNPVHPLRLVAAHVNHGLRKEALEDEMFVRRLCERLAVPLQVFNLSLGDKPSGVSSEEYWRQQRYDAFEKTLTESQGNYLALGHNADDLAETFLFHLVRGTGILGLTFSFYKKSGRLPIIRPLWKTQRITIETVLESIGQSWMIDPSNVDTRYSRNMIRHDVLPLLKKLNPRASEAIMRASQSISAHGEHPEIDLAQERVELTISSLRGISDSSTAREVYSLIASRMRSPPGERQVNQAVTMIRNNRSGIVALGYKHSLVITQTQLWLAPLDQPTDLQLALAHTKHFSAITADLKNDLSLDSGEATIALLNGQTIKLTLPAGRGLVLRNRQPGDLVGTKPLKKIMIEYQIPWYLRDYLVLVAEDKQVLNLVGTFPELNKWIVRHTGRDIVINSQSINLH